jgi:hypothetical protein
MSDGSRRTLHYFRRIISDGLKPSEIGHCRRRLPISDGLNLMSDGFGVGRCSVYCSDDHKRTDCTKESEGTSQAPTRMPESSFAATWCLGQVNNEMCEKNIFGGKKTTVIRCDKLNWYRDEEISSFQKNKINSSFNASTNTKLRTTCSCFEVWTAMRRCELKRMVISTPELKIKAEFEPSCSARDVVRTLHRRR